VKQPVVTWSKKDKKGNDTAIALVDLYAKQAAPPSTEDKPLKEES